MKKLSSNKLLLGFLGVVIICCSILSIKLFSKLSVSKVSAEEIEKKYDKTTYNKALVNCGAGMEDGSDILAEYFELTSNYDKNSTNRVIISAKNGKFRSILRVNNIINAHNGLIADILDKNGMSLNKNDFVYVDANNSVIVVMNLVNGEDAARLIKIEFGLAENHSSGNYGCVSEDTYLELKDHENQDDFDDLLAKGPTLKDKPNDTTYGTYHGMIQFDVPLNIQNVSTTSEQNIYYDNLCADYRGETNNSADDTLHFSKDILKKRQELNSSSEALEQLKNAYADCWSTEINGVPKKDSLRPLLEDIVSTTWINYVGARANTGSDAELAQFKNSSYFEEVKNKAKNTSDSVNGTHYLENQANVLGEKGKVFSLKCNTNPKADFNTHFLSYVKGADGTPAYNIHANQEYFYTSKSEPYDITFERTYTSGEKEPVTIGKCNKVCEEAVIVEYGPPIASSAGLCFEYQVQVTSKIKCSVSAQWEKPPTFELCTPKPYCNPYYGYTHQGGPTEEFESCISKCDGGKYTEKCSEKCYKKVYSKPENRLNKESFNIKNNIIAKKVYNLNPFPGYAGRYTYNGGVISWQSSIGINTYARYYQTYEPNRTEREHYDASGDGTGALYYNPDSRGFKRANYSYGQCNEYCSYSGCSSKSYLNQEDINNDKNEYSLALKTGLDKCSALASCTTRTAYFTMKVDYYHNVKSGDDSNKTKVTITFPYDTKSGENIDSVERETDKCSGNPKTKLANGSHTVLNYAGCYKNCGKDDGYHTKWSFPGGWSNDKSGEISYLDKSKDNSWTKFPKKFCVPADALEVNGKFVTYYYHYKSVPSYHQGEYVNTGDWYDPNEIEWNILAQARNFGHYGWNFDISCFYGLANKQCIYGDCNRSSQYKINTVDLTDLFPDTNGVSKNNPDSFNVVDKALPFNWSTRSIQKNTPLPTAKIDPTSYGKYVQTKGYDIYNDDELEYHFHLTPDLMSKFNKRDYKLYSESAKPYTKNGIKAYVSNLLRNDSSFSSAAVRIPPISVLGCNNIHGVKDGTGSAGSCMSVDEMNK